MRLPGWEERLAAAIEEAIERPFEYGRFDCLTWAFGVRAALTGIDDRPRWAGRYRTALGGARVLRNEGVPTLEDVGHRLLGSPLATPLVAHRGDIAFADAFGVVTGAEFVWPAVERGLMSLPLSEASVAWRVG